jgi:hypothetical protein
LGIVGIVGIEVITIVHERVSEGLGFALVVGKRWCWWCSCFVLTLHMAFFWGTIDFFYRCLFVVSFCCVYVAFHVSETWFYE